MFARDIKADGAMTALLKDALNPNLVQTLEGTPALIHGGPFANIAHGTNSVIATGLGLRLVDYVVTETGFASDLGAEKFFDIVVRTGQVPPPAACVLVATLRALKLHGGVEGGRRQQRERRGRGKGTGEPRQAHREPEDLRRPVRRGPQPLPDGHEVRDRDVFRAFCGAKRSVRFALSDVHGKGGEGGVELAREVLAAIERGREPLPVPLSRSRCRSLEKIETIARRIYGADGVRLEPRAKRKLESAWKGRVRPASRLHRQDAILALR